MSVFSQEYHLLVFPVVLCVQITLNSKISRISRLRRKRICETPSSGSRTITIEDLGESIN